MDPIQEEMNPSLTPTAKQPNKLEQWLFSVAAKKAAYGIAKFLTSIVTSLVVQNELRKFGVTVDPQVFTPAVSVAVMGALEFAHDWLKLKTGASFL